MRTLLMLALAFTVSGCGKEPERVDINFDAVAPMSNADEASDKRQRVTIAKRFNQRALEINARLKAAYIRGQQVCANLKAEGVNREGGCPRPVPNYVDLMDESGAYP